MSYLDKNGNYYEGDKQYGDIDVPKRPNPTDTWDGTQWNALVPTLDERKQNLIDTDEAAYELAIQEPIAYLGTTFQADKKSRELLTDVLVAAGFVMPAGFMWRDANDQAVLVEGALLQGLATQILVRGQPLFWAKSARKDAINACLTSEELELFLNPPPPVVPPVTPPEVPVP